MRTKTAEMGIGTLIILISLLIVAAIAASIMVQTSGNFNEQTLTSADTSKDAISINVRTLEVKGEDGSSGYLRNFTQEVRLAAGSEEIDLDQILYVIILENISSQLQYAGKSATYDNGPTGYYTFSEDDKNIIVTNYGASWETPRVDYNFDNLADTLFGGSDSNVTIAISGDATYNLGRCLNGAWQQGNEARNYIASNAGTCGAGAQGNETYYITLVMNNTLYTQHAGKGFFSAEFIKNANNPIDGVLQMGDIVRIHFETPRNVIEDEMVRINIIPPKGAGTYTDFLTPNVMNEKIIKVFP